MNRYKYILFIIGIIFKLIDKSECQLDSTESSCIQSLGSLLGDSRYQISNIGSIFCTAFPYASCIDGKVYTLDVIQTTNYKLTWSDLSCFSILYAFQGSGLNLDTDFIQTAPQNIKRLDIVSSNIISIDYVVPSFEYFNIGGLQGPIKSSYINNVLEFYATANSAVPNYLEIDQTVIGGNIKKIEVSITSVPNLSLLPNLKEVRFNILSNLDTNTYQNFYSFGFATTIKFVNSDGQANIPFPYILTQITKPAFSRLEFRGVAFRTPTNYIDFSNMVSEGSIVIEKPGSNFNINGNLPISKLPSTRLNEFYIMDSYIPNIPDFNMFKNVSNLVLRNLQMEGTLPTIEQTLDFKDGIDLSNNKLTNTLDQSWCGIQINLRDNILFSIPECYQCYSSDSRVINNFNGNPITLNPLSGCDSLNFIQPKFVISDSKLIVSGNNIGYYGDNIESTPSLVFNRVSKNQFIADLSTSPMDTQYQIHWKIPDITFNIQLPIQAPIIDLIVQNGIEITINGSYFSYYPSDVIVTIPDQNVWCSVTESTFELIKCKLPDPVKMDGSFQVVVNVAGLQSTTSLVIVNTACSVPDCNGRGLCDYQTRQCICIPKYSTVGDKICSVPNHYLTSYTQVPSDKGGLITLYGWFDISNDLSIKIGQNDCALQSGNNAIITCIVQGGSVGIQQQINITQNGIVWLGSIYPYYDTSSIVCYNNCTSPTNGQCLSNGNCQCNSGFKGLDCSGIINNSTTVELPKTETNVTDGSVILSNQDSDFMISIDSINELDISNRIVQSHPIGNWSIHKEKQNAISSFIQNLNGASVILTIEEIDTEKDKEFEFAGSSFTVDAGGIKISISIDGWQYKSVLNIIQLVMTTHYQENQLKQSNTCNKDNIQIDSSSNLNSINSYLNYLKIENKGKSFFGRFQDKAISNNHTVFITTQIINQNSDKNKVYLGINLPHCDNCLIDPDFSVIVSPNFINKCSSNGRESWFLPVVIVVPVVGLVLISVISSIIYKKNRGSIKIKLNEIKLMKF